MKLKQFKICAVALMLMGLCFAPTFQVFAEEGEEEANDCANTTGTSISLMPVSKIIQIASGQEYHESLQVINDGNSDMKIEVYAAPYSYVYSDEEDLYKLGFTNENNYTQLSRWITFDDGTGNYVEKAVFSIPPCSSSPNNRVDISFRINTPSSIPGGGQYAVVFAHTLSSASAGGGIRTEASPGMVIYGRSTEGEANVSAELSDLKIEEKEGNITASAKVKNSGNVDFNAKGILRVDPIIGFSSYETDANTGAGRLSVIPETELIISDEWKESPGFGIFKATYTVSVGEKTEMVERVLFRIPIFVILIIIIVLTILTLWIILKVRKRRERRSRLAV